VRGADDEQEAHVVTEPGPDTSFDLLVTNAAVVLGGIRDEQYRVVEGTSIGVVGDRFGWIGPDGELGETSAARTIDARGMLAVPGLINTHNHLFQNLVKGIGDEMYLLPWVETLILPTANEMTPEETYLGALLGCLEAIRSGTTALMDFMFGVPDIEVHRAVLRAIRDSGIRGFFGRATRDLNPDSGWRDPWYLPLDEVFDQMRQLSREFPSGLPVASVLPAPGTVRTMTVDGLLQVKEYARTEGTQITIHMGEYTEERDTAIDRWGIGAFHKGEEIGFLGPEVVAAHCVKLDEAELEIVARTGTQVSFNPVSNAYLGNGVAPIPRMLELGIDVSLATDGGACANTEDMLEAMKFGVLIQKSEAQDPRVFNARDILRLATVGGATALGLPSDLGAIEAGRLADFFLFDPYRLKSVPMHEPLSTLVYAGEQTNVDTIVIDGQVVLEGGRFATVDEEAFVREVHERALALSRRIGTFRLVEGRRFTPFGYDRVRSAPASPAPSIETETETSASASDDGESAAAATGRTVSTPSATTQQS
jgi:5-methylthioadenosine/S-adenosylhomocysteine deaminase